MPKSKLFTLLGAVIAAAAVTVAGLVMLSGGGITPVTVALVLGLAVAWRFAVKRWVA